MNSWWLIVSLLAAAVAVSIMAWSIRMCWNLYRELHPHAEVVQAQRHLHGAGRFRRHWIERKPQAVLYDRLNLECGHYIYWSLNRDLAPDEMVECGECERRFLRNSRRSLAKIALETQWTKN